MAISHTCTMANSRYCVKPEMMAFSLHLWVSRFWVGLMGRTPLQPQDKYVLRLPDGMRDKLKAAAANAKRSMNAEIVARLELSFEAEPGETIAAIRERIFNTANPSGLADEISPTEIIESELQRAVREAIVSTLSRLETEGITSVMLNIAEEQPTMFHKLTRRDEAALDQNSPGWRSGDYPSVSPGPHKDK